MQTVGPVHETEVSPARPGSAGVSSDQAVPSHASAMAAYPPDDVFLKPTAWQAVALGHETPPRPASVALVGTAGCWPCQASVNTSARPRFPKPDVWEKPAAVQSIAGQHDTPFSPLESFDEPMGAL